MPWLPAAHAAGDQMEGGHAMPPMSGTVSGPLANAPLSEGEIRKVDKASGKVTIKHGPLANLDMPGMVMVFRVKNPTWLDQMKAGDKVRFLAESVDGALTVIQYEPVK